MSHVRSGSFTDESGMAYLWTTKEVNGRPVPVERIGGPYPSDEHADAMSKAVSEAVGEGSIAEYKKWLSANNDLFVLSTRMGGIPKSPLMKLPGDDVFTHSLTPWGLLDIPYDSWREHEIFSNKHNLPFSAPEDERRAASRTKTDNLIDFLGDVRVWDRAKLAALGAGHQVKQGLDTGEWSPNWYDYKGNWDSIWDFDRKKKKRAN